MLNTEMIVRIVYLFAFGKTALQKLFAMKDNNFKDPKKYLMNRGLLLFYLSCRYNTHNPILDKNGMISRGTNTTF